MFAFVVLFSLITVSIGAPQYDYRQAEHLISDQSVGYSGLPAGSAAISQPISQVNGGEKYLPPAPASAAPIVRKQFYVVSAPQDEDSQQINKHLVLGRPQRIYRVVFIKAPSSGVSNVKYSAEFAPQEEKTVIYVLSKKSNELVANDIATPAPPVASKPEVFFIKYKTDEEAHQAQKEIQGEYDKLGGTNEVADATTASITSVIGSLDSINADGSYNYRQQSAGPSLAKAQLSGDQAASAQYLPSLFKRQA